MRRINNYSLIKIFATCLLFYCASANAQSQNDSLFYQQTINNVTTLYKSTIKANLYLYNGSEYPFSGHNIKGYPFFKSADLLPGSVFYDGNLYNDVLLHYDLTNDELIILDYTKNYPIQLITNKIKYFTIDSSEFINAEAKELSPFADETGFYEELYYGKTIVFAKKKKLVITKNSTEGFADSYKQYDNYFIYKDEKIYKANNENAVLNVFKRKSELKKFITVNNISFKKDFENALIKTAQYFDTLKN